MLELKRRIREADAILISTPDDETSRRLMQQLIRSLADWTRMLQQGRPPAERAA